LSNSCLTEKDKRGGEKYGRQQFSVLASRHKKRKRRILLRKPVGQGQRCSTERKKKTQATKKGVGATFLKWQLNWKTKG